MKDTYTNMFLGPFNGIHYYSFVPKAYVLSRWKGRDGAELYSVNLLRISICRWAPEVSATFLLQVTKIFQKKKNSVTYSFRQSFSLYGMQVLLFENQCKSCQLLSFCAYCLTLHIYSNFVAVPLTKCLFVD